MYVSCFLPSGSTRRLQSGHVYNETVNFMEDNLSLTPQHHDHHRTLYTAFHETGGGGSGAGRQSRKTMKIRREGCISAAGGTRNTGDGRVIGGGGDREEDKGWS